MNLKLSLLYVGLLLGCSLWGLAQNEWINFDQTYYKFQSEQTGLHRISYETLVEHGLDLNGSHFKVYMAGQQIPIYVTTSENFGVGDYIEFFGETNDGAFDTQLFAEPNEQLKTEVSLFTDTRSYYLVSEAEGEHLRILDEVNDLTNLPPAEPYFMYESKKITDNSYHFGEPMQFNQKSRYPSRFDKGEGWVSGIVLESLNPVTGSNIGYDVKVNTTALYEDNPSLFATVDCKVVGRNASQELISDQQLEITVDGITYAEDFFNDFEVRNYTFTIPASSINTEPNFANDIETRIKFLAWDGEIDSIPYDTRYSVAYANITYPRRFDFEGESTFDFALEMDGTKYLEIENFNGATNSVLYDLTANKRYQVVFEDDKYKVKINTNGVNQNHRFFLSHASQNSFAIHNVTDLTPRNFTDYSLAANQGNYLIVYNESLTEGIENPIQNYVNYRSSEMGGNYGVVTVEIEELYDQFAWGIDKHPMSIKNFVQTALNEWNIEPEHLLIIGKGIRYDKTRYNNGNFDDCLIPSYGYAPSDFMFVTATTQDTYPLLPVGRIPAKNSQEVQDYLDKVIAHDSWYTMTDDCETIADRAWMKKALHLAKGWGTESTDYVKNHLEEHKAVLTEPCLGLNIVGEFEDNHSVYSPLTTTDIPEVKTLIEDGLSWIHYKGQADGEPYLPFALAHPSEYNNPHKYPFVFAETSFVAKIHEPEGIGMAEGYLLEPEGGSIGFLGYVGITEHGITQSELPVPITDSLDFSYLFSTQFIATITQEAHYQKTFGEQIIQTMQDLYNPNDELAIMSTLELSYAGDPAVGLYSWERPEFLMQAENLSISPTTFELELIDEINIEVLIENYGKIVPEMIDLTITQYGPNGELIAQMTEAVSIDAAGFMYTTTFPISNDTPNGESTFVFTIDSNQQYNEDCENNNTLSHTIYIESANMTGEDITVIAPKIFLEGAYNVNAGTMNTMLQSQSLLPLIQPYVQAPYYYFGTENVTVFDANVVDWVLVEVREGTPNLTTMNTTIVARKAALLLSDGTIVDVAGNDGVVFNNLVYGNEYYLCVRHRNHLDVLSATPFVAAPSITYDFSNSATAAFGAFQVKALKENVFGMYAGEFSQDGVIQVSDYDLWKVAPAINQTYMNTDANLDGIVQNTDNDFWIPNKAKIGAAEIR